MNIEDEITVKAGLRTTKVLVEFSPDGAGGWLVRQLFPTGDRGDMDMLACERFFGSISALAEIVEAEIHARHGQSEIIPDEGEPIPYAPILPAHFETPLNFREAA
ncbi:hypothetical protein A9J41_15445 [Laribacter hongkongensis]|uniref:hypothetical protein n=1 Tax=Laribacter hongkongensis TaxID=168471 RepID=UPI001877D7AC|nr:hypothetical protein [Laribacter hongkongensis]MBE5529684.1 hypothetical protein [Laribacter hongkongensis]